MTAPAAPRLNAETAVAALRAVLEGIDIPPATVTNPHDYRLYAEILESRCSSVVIAVDQILRLEMDSRDAAQALLWLRAALAFNPATGYQTRAEYLAARLSPDLANDLPEVGR